MLDAAIHTIGDKSLLDRYKVAFLCSRNCPAAVTRQARDWAVAQREKDVCVISGFHSLIEKEVLSLLLQGSQPVIVALAMGLGRGVSPQWRVHLEAGRLLALTRYAESVSHPCEEKCFQRNRLMMELADEIVVAYAAPGGRLERLCREYRGARPVRSLSGAFDPAGPGEG